MSQPWTLRILNGTHQGASVPLESGSFTLGGEDSCDLILQDPTMVDKTAEFTVSDEAVTYRKLGLSEDEPGKAINSGEKVRLSGIEFIFLKGDEPYIPTAQAQISAPGPQAEPPRTHQSPKPKAGRIIIGALVLGLIGYLAYTSLGGDSSESADKVEQQQAKLDLPAGVEITDKNGTKVLSGYVSDEAARTKLMTDIQTSGQVVTGKVRVMRGLIEAAQMTLKGHKWSHIKVSEGTQPGSIKLEGFASDSEAWSQVKLRLIKDLPAVAKWQDKVLTAQGQSEILTAMIKTKGLADYVRVKPEGETLQISGSIPNDKLSEWQGVKAAYEAEYGTEPKIVGVAGRLNNLKVKSISLGKVPYVTTDDGAKILVGAPLQGGTVHKILEDRIVIQRGNDLVPLFFQ